jgi:hypothetical protein
MEATIQGSGDINSVRLAQKTVAGSNSTADKLRASMIGNQKLKNTSKSKHETVHQKRIKEKKDALNDLVKQYNLNTLQLKNDLINKSNTDQLAVNQNKEIDRNTSKLMYLKNDIYTFRKQLETSENEFKKKSFLVFFLKNIFVFLMLTCIVIILVKNGLLSSNIGIKIQIGLACVLGFIILINLFLHRNTHNIIFSKQNWNLKLPPVKKE